MIVKIDNYEIETEEIVKFYPCDVLGNYQEQTGFTHIEFKDGFNGVYLCNATELLGKIEKGGVELKDGSFKHIYAEEMAEILRRANNE